MIQKLEYASFWERLTAFMLDMFIIILPIFGMATILSVPIFFDMPALEAAHSKEFEALYQYYKSGVFFLLTGFIAVSLVLALFTISNWQATPGKRLVNIYIARKNGSKISFADAFGRFISLPLFILMLKIFERREDFAALDQLKRNGKIITDISTLQPYLSGPAAQITFMAVFATIIFWFCRIFFTPENTALHDTLFNTRVFRGKK